MSADLPLRGSNLEDEMYHLKDQNRDLKKQLNNQNDTTKRHPRSYFDTNRLMTQVQRLSVDLRKNRTTPMKGGALASRRQDVEVETTVEEMRVQMQQSQRMNSDLRSKVKFGCFRLHQRFNISSRFTRPK